MTKSSKHPDRRLNRLIGLFFAVSLGFPLVSGLLHWDPGIRLEEKRHPAPPPNPGITFSEWLEYPARFESYVEDTFKGRRLLVSGFGQIRSRIPGLIVGRKVLVGRQRWFYFAVPHTLNDYRGLIRPSPSELDAMGRIMEARRKWLDLLGIRYLVVFAPAKWEIYPEFIPGNLNRVRPASQLDDIFDYLKENTGLEVLDLRPALKSAKTGGRVYQRDDTHWTDRGSFTAGRRISKKIKAWFPAAETVSLKNYQIQESQKSAGDLAVMMGLPTSRKQLEFELIPDASLGSAVIEAHAKDPRPGIRIFEKPAERNPRLKAVIYHDSFGDLLQKYLKFSFDRSVFVAAPHMGRELILREKPDVVIQEMGQRNLLSNLMANPVSSPGSASEFSSKRVSLLFPASFQPASFKARALTAGPRGQLLFLQINDRPAGEWRIDTWEREYIIPEGRVPESEGLARYRFDYRYTVESSSRGRTQAAPPMHLAVETGGGRCFVGFNGGALTYGNGYNIYRIDLRGNVRSQRNFDTRRSRERSRRMAEHIQSNREKSGYMLIVSCSSAGENLTAEAVEALASLGLKADLRDREPLNHIALVRTGRNRVIVERAGKGRQEFQWGPYNQKAGFQITRINRRK